MRYSSCKTKTTLLIVLLVSVVFMGTFPHASAAGNFGNDHAGSSYTEVSAENIVCGKWTLGGVEQYTDTIRFYGRAPDASPKNGKAIICDSSLNIIAVGDPSTISNSNEWQTLTFLANVTLEASTTYYIGFISDFLNRVYYDDTGDYVIDTTNSYASPTDPTDGGTDTTREYSIYAVTYDEPPDTRTATSGTFVGQNEVNSWESTKSKDGTDWYADPQGIHTLTFPIRNDTWSFDYHIYAYKEGVISGEAYIQVYNFETTYWLEIEELTESPAWYNGTISDSDYMDTTNNEVKLRMTSDFLYYPRWDYADITIYYGPHPVWNTINDVEFVLPIDWSEEFQFGYDALFILLGLIMIPASTLYLVRGGRKDMSTDKLFYVLIVFFVGCGLFIGGILP